MSLVRDIYKGLSGPLGREIAHYSSASYRGNDGMWFWGKNGTERYFSYAGLDSSVKAYEQCAPVTAIINKKAQAFINGKTWVLNKEGKEDTSKAAEKLRKLLKRPNPIQTWKQFEAQAYVYKELFGFNIIFSVKPSGFKSNIDAQSIWNIPPSMVDITETNKLFYQSDLSSMISGIVLTYNGETTRLDINDVFFIKDITPSFGSMIFPDSKLKSLQLQINNIMGCYESRNVLINYRGALGILTNEKDQYGSVPIDQKDKDQLQSDFNRYGLKNNQWQFIITSASLRWQSMGYPTKELMLFEEIEDDIMRICDSLSYPYQLISSAKGTTFSNVKEAKSLLYYDSIIPDAENFYEQLTSFFGLEELGLRLDKDYSHIPALQDDEVQKATARKTRNEAYRLEWESDLITRNQWREANGEDPVPGDDQLRSQLMASSQPLAISIGEIGMQGLINILTNPAMTADSKVAAIEILYGINSADGRRMVNENTTTL